MTVLVAISLVSTEAWASYSKRRASGGSSSSGTSGTQPQGESYQAHLEKIRNPKSLKDPSPAVRSDTSRTDTVKPGRILIAAGAAVQKRAQKTKLTVIQRSSLAPVSQAGASTPTRLEPPLTASTPTQLEQPLTASTPTRLELPLTASTPTRYEQPLPASTSTWQAQPLPATLSMGEYNFLVNLGQNIGSLDRTKAVYGIIEKLKVQPRLSAYDYEYLHRLAQDIGNRSISEGLIKIAERHKP